MAVLANISGVFAIAGRAVVFDRALSTVFARVGLLAGINVLAVVQRNIAHHPFAFDEEAGLNFHAINFQISQASDETGSGRLQAASDDELIADVER